MIILQQGQGEHRFPSGDYDIAMWDQGLRHGPAVYYHSNGSKEECTYVEGYENGPSTVYFAKYVSQITLFCSKIQFIQNFTLRHIWIFAPK